MQREDAVCNESRDERDGPASQATPRTASKALEAGREAGNRFPLAASEGVHLANASIVDSQPAELRDGSCLLCKTLGLWDSATATLGNEDTIHRG